MFVGFDIGPFRPMTWYTSRNDWPGTESRGVVGFEMILGAYTSLLSVAATSSVLLVS